jgi:membrane protein YdbS with pleckstrin-like domain
MAVMTAAPVREPAWSMPRSSISLWVTESIISCLFLGVAVGAFLLFVPAELGGPVPVLRRLVPVALAAYAVIAIGVRPWLQHRVYRWEITADAAYTRTGWLTQTWTLVPISRIQTVDVTRGVLQQLFGLATVTVTTASAAGPLHIEGLDVRLAGELVEQLTATTQATPGDAT